MGTFSGWFLTTHSVNKKLISLSPKNNRFLYAGVYCILVWTSFIAVFIYFTSKVVQQNHQEGSSIVKYQLKQSFVTKVVRIFPYAYGQYGCLRTQKIYGCDPSSGKLLSAILSPMYTTK